MGSSKIRTYSRKEKELGIQPIRTAEMVFFFFFFFFYQEEKIAKYTEKERKVKEVGFRPGSVQE